MKLAPRLTADSGALRERFLALKTPRDVADLLEVPYSVLVYLLYQSDKASRYELFTIPKRSGGIRTIMSPNKSLKLLQQKLNSTLATVYRPKPSVHGFVEGRSVVTNAKPHCRRRLVLNVDLEGFFPTINFGRVRGMFMARPYALPAPVATVLAQLCCFDNQLPQGAPTSPIVSNMVCSRLDTQLQALAQGHQLFYTRYADDITLSTFRTQFPEVVCNSVSDDLLLGSALEAIITANGFSINRNKVHLQRWDSHQEVTGVTVNRKPNASRSFIRQIRAMLHAWDKYDLEAAARVHFHRGKDEPSQKNDCALYKSIIRGKIAYLGMIRGKDGLYAKYSLELDRLIARVDPLLLKSEAPMNITKVFVSHSAKDIILATALVQCLEGCLEIPDGDIRCTSVDGYKLDPGSNAHDSLRANLEHCKAVVGLLTEDSLKSGFVFMELGAAWGLRKITYPLLGPTIDFTRIPGPLATTHAIKVNREPDIAQFVDAIAKQVGFPVRNPGRVTSAVQAFVKTATSLVNSSGGHTQSTGSTSTQTS